jgi:hypothetical protein
MTQLFTKNLNEAVLNGIYGTYLNQLLEDNWTTTDEGDLYRQAMIVDGNHNLAVVMNFVTLKALDAFEFIKGTEADKDIKALYQARLALKDMVQAMVGADLDVDTLNGIIDAIREQVRRGIVGGLRKDATYTIDEADVLMNDLWYFITDGIHGTANDNLVYGQDQLTKDGEFTKPETLVTTKVLATDETVAGLNALFEAN